MFNIENRRYVGNKFKLMTWIQDILKKECPECESFFDVFAGTGAVSAFLLPDYKSFILNDFLFSNEAIYKGFFASGKYSKTKLQALCRKYNSLNKLKTTNYVSEMYGDKFFSMADAQKIGWIRQDIEDLKQKEEITSKEYYILLTSLLYSSDRIANTVGHYDAYIKGKIIREGFVFDLINVLDVKKKQIKVYREDSNNLAKKVTADIAFLDPPYNSRQYSRFYHVLENITKWTKPELFGVAMKPKEENMSEYCKTSAAGAFSDLVSKLKTKYIVVTYNNTYNPKSSSSLNKISFEQIMDILSTRGKTVVFDKPYKFFNAGKTNFDDHKEFVFVTKVEK